MLEHIRMLFDTTISTKECLEDVIGTLTDTVKRGNRNPFKALAPERAFFQASQSIRWGRVELAEGDLLRKDMQEYAANRAKTFTIPIPDMVARSTPKCQLPAQRLWDSRAKARFCALRLVFEPTSGLRRRVLKTY